MSSQRTNCSRKSEIEFSKVFAEGTFKNVYAGIYTSGPQKGEACVWKQFKTGSVYEDHYFDDELAIINRTQQIIDDFQAAGIIDQAILLNTPQIWHLTKSKAKGLVEPMIDNFEKFNSNTGWAPKSKDVWSSAMQALSHFSYDDSGGELLLCDIQGGSYQDGYVLSDPVLMSREQNCGPSDLGPDGINSFFNRHRCNEYCRQGWLKPPKVEEAVYPEREGTTMVAPDFLPKRDDRTALTLSKPQFAPVLPQRPDRQPLPRHGRNLPPVPLFPKMASKSLPAPVELPSVPESKQLVVTMKYQQRQANDIQCILQAPPTPTDDLKAMERKGLESETTDKETSTLPDQEDCISSSVPHLLLIIPFLKRKRDLTEDGEGIDGRGDRWGMSKDDKAK